MTLFKPIQTRSNLTTITIAYVLHYILRVCPKCHPSLAHIRITPKPPQARAATRVTAHVPHSQSRAIAMKHPSYTRGSIKPRLGNTCPLDTLDSPANHSPHRITGIRDKPVTTTALRPKHIALHLGTRVSDSVQCARAAIRLRSPISQ